jgi:hypothetical protein
VTDLDRLWPARAIVERVGQRHAAERFQVSRTIVHRWPTRYRALEGSGMADRAAVNDSSLAGYTDIHPLLAMPISIPDETGQTAVGFVQQA